MAERKNKQIYQSGELEKTRKNLGNIDKQEALRVAALLGGEIGLEKDSRTVQQGYEKLSSYNRRKTDSPGRGSGNSPQKPDIKGEASQGGGNSSAAPGIEEGQQQKKKPGRARRPLIIDGSKRQSQVKKSQKKYWVRIRTNFLAARREHNIKTFAVAFSSVFSFIPTRDEINPRFIREAQRNLFEPISTIQKNAETLLKAGLKRSSKYRPDPFYKAVLEVLASWDTRSIGRELSKLEKLSSGLTAESLARFCRAIFIPVIRLQNLDSEGHVINSIRHFYELHLKISSSADPEVTAGLKKKSLELMELYPLIFKRIHHGCYPLLMSLSCSTYSQYDEFYPSCLSDYLSFLLIEEDNLLPPPDERPPVSPEENSQVQTEWEPAKQEKTPIPAEFAEGLSFLQEMFPQGGFEDMAQFPDFCPYFLPLFDLPKNFELLPPEDPIQGISIMITFLKELFFAFGSVEFTSIKNDEWDLLNIRSSFEEYTAVWYSYLENFLPKLLLPPLLEYCRGIEKNSDFGASPYGEKLSAKIFWLKKTYCLPHLEVIKTLHGKAPVTRKTIRLYHLTEDLYSLFTAILKTDLPDPGVKNMEAPIHFEVPTEISERFIKILKKRGMEGINRDLLRISAALLCLLNELLNKSNSFYYKSSFQPIIRTEKNNRDIPIYSVKPLNSMQIITDWDKRMAAGQVEGACVDEPSAEIRNCGREELKGAIKNLLNNDKTRLEEESDENTNPTQAVLIRLKISDPVKQNPMESVLKNTLRLGPDQWYRISETEWLLTLSETAAEGAIRLTKRLLSQLAPLYDPSILLYAGLTPLQPEWTPDQGLYLSDNTIKEAEKRGGEVIILYNPEEKKYRLYTIKNKNTEKGEK